MPIITYFGFFLSVFREIADALQIAYHAGSVIYIVRAAVRAVVGSVFVDVSAIVANSYADIETEVIATRLSRYIQQFVETFLGRILLEVAMIGRPTV
jgi:hypothetical protein